MIGKIKKMGEWNIGMLGFGHFSFFAHYSIIPFFTFYG